MFFHTHTVALQQKLKVFKRYYSRLSCSLPIKKLTPHFVSEDLITFKEEEEILKETDPSGIFLRKIAYSLEGGTDVAFDKMLCVIYEHGDTPSKELMNEIKKEL